MNGSRSRHNSKVEKNKKKSLIAPHIAVLPKSGIRDFFELVNSMDDVISLGIGEPDFVTPWNIRESAIYSLESGKTHYTSNLGLFSLRKAICSYMSSDYDLDYDPVHECIVTVGVSEALDLVIRAITSPGDEIIYHEPCYVSYGPEIRMAHGVPVAVKTYEKNDFALDPDDLEKAITPKTKAILLNFPCNPTGATLTYEQTEQIAKIAVRHNLIVLADHIYTELTYGEMTPSIATFLGLKERTVFIHQYSMLCASITAQEAALEALRSGKKDMLAMKADYRDRRNVIVKRLNEMGLKCFLPEGAFYIFPNITSSGLSSKDFATQLLMKKKVAVVPGTAFGECGEGFVRCSYATSMDGIKEAMDKIAEFLKELKAGKKKK